MKIINKIEKVISGISANSWLLLFFLANLFVKTYQITSLSLYGDEPYSIFYAQQKFSDSLPYLLKDQNPPLHLTLLHYWMNLFGIADDSAKMFSVVCSVLASIVLFRFANKFIDKTTAIFASFLFLFSNAQQYFATEVRPYALIQLLCIVSFYIYFSLLNTPKIKHLFSLFLINLLLLFTHYLTAFIFVVQFFGILFHFRNNKKTILYYFISQVMVLLIIVPWLKVAFSNVPKAGAFWNKIPDYFAFRWHTNILLGNEKLYVLFNLLVVCSIILVVLSNKIKIFNADFKTKYYFIFLLLYVLPILLNFLVAQYSPVFTTRYFLYSLFGLFLLIAYTFSKLNIKSFLKIILFAPLVIILYMMFNVIQERQDDWKHEVPDIARLKETNSLIYISASYKYKEFSFYYDIDAFKDYHHTIERLAKENVFVTPDNQFDGWKKLNFNSIKKVIYVQAHSQFEDSLNQIKPFIIDHGFKECDYVQNGGVKYTVFIRDTMECYQVNIISPNKNNACDLFERYVGVNRSNETVDVYKATFEYAANCPPNPAITSQVKYSGNYSFKINETNQFALGIMKPKNEYMINTRQLKLAAYVNLEEANEGHLVVSVENGINVLYRNDIYLKDEIHTANQWQKVTLNSTLPLNIPENAVVKIYFWNPSKKNIFVDDFTIQLF